MRARSTSCCPTMPTRSRSTARRRSTAARRSSSCTCSTGARTIARRWLYEVADEIRITALMEDDDARVAGLAAKINREEAYHRMHAEMWRERLADTPQFRAAVDELWPYALGVLPPEQRDALAARARPRRGRRGRARRARRRVRGAARRDDDGAPLGARGCAMVTAEQVWERVRGDPRPGDPGHLARRPRRHPFGRCPRRTRPRGVHADVPRLPRARGDEARARGVGERARRRARRAGDPGRLVVDRQDHARGPREAARRRLRAAGAARGVRAEARAAAVERLPLPVLRLDARRSSRTSSARRRAARSATARAAGSRSSSSRRSSRRRRATPAARSRCRSAPRRRG